MPNKRPLRNALFATTWIVLVVFVSTTFVQSLPAHAAVRPPIATHTSSISGTYTVRYVDPKPDSPWMSSQIIAGIDTGSGFVRVNEDQVPAGVNPGDRVLLTKPGALLKTFAKPTAKTRPPGLDIATTGTKKVLLAMVQWSGNPADTVTDSNATTLLAQNANWYHTVSGGRLAMPGTSTGWVTITPPTGSCSGDFIAFTSSMMNLTWSKLTAMGYNLASYDTIALYFASSSAQTECAWAGLGGGGQVWMAGDADLSVLVHELGHTLNLGHAAKLSCTTASVPVALGDDCVGQEYADRSDAMGNGPPAMFAAPHLDALGWFGPGELVTVTPPASGSDDQTFTLGPLETLGAGTRAVKVELADGSAIYFENRQMLGIDVNNFSPYSEGVLVHYRPSSMANLACNGNLIGCAADQYLLEATAGISTKDPTWRLQSGNDLTLLNGAVSASVQNGSGDDMTLNLHVAAFPIVAPTIESIAPGDAQATVTWTEATGALGRPPSKYLIEWNDLDNEFVRSEQTTSAASSYTVYDLPQGRYQFRVTGINEFGTGVASAWSSPIDIRVHVASEAFVNAAYRDFLGRAATTQEVLTNSQRLDQGTTSRAEFVEGLANSSEWVGAVVNAMYIDTLGRTGEPGGVTFWSNQIRRGTRSVAQVAGSMYASNEYYTGIGGGTDTTWVRDLYTKLLLRSADSSGLTYWRSQIATHGRTWVATSFYNSPESARTRINNLYQKLLGRNVDPAGARFWTPRVIAQGDIALAVDLAVSPEYFTRAQARFP